MKKLFDYLLMATLVIAVLYIIVDTVTGNYSKRSNSSSTTPYTIVSTVSGPYNQANIRRTLKSVKVNPEHLEKKDSLKDIMVRNEQIGSEFQIIYLFKEDAMTFSEKYANSTDELIQYQRRAEEKAEGVIHIPPNGEGLVYK